MILFGVLLNLIEVRLILFWLKLIRFGVRKNLSHFRLNFNGINLFWVKFNGVMLF